MGRVSQAHAAAEKKPFAGSKRCQRLSRSRPDSGHTLGHTVVKPRVTPGAPGLASDGRSAAPSPARRRLLGLKEAAGYLGVSPWTLRELVWRGDLPRIRLPRVRRLLFDLTDLDRLVEESKGR